MSCLRSNLFARRTIAASARSSMRLETYHSGSLSFLCGAVGWQKSTGIVLSLHNPRSHDHAGEHLDDIDRPHDHEHQCPNGEECAPQPIDITCHVHISLQHTKDHEN